MKVLQFPLTRVVIGFVLGILFAYYSKLGIRVGFEMILICFSLFSISYFLQKNSLKKGIFFGLATFLLFFSIGSITLITHNESNQEKHYSHHLAYFETENLLEVTIQEKIKSTTKNDRYIATVSTINDSIVTGKILLNCPKEIANKKFETGAQLLIKERLIQNKLPFNPNQFDYGKYLENKQIYGQLYLNTRNHFESPIIHRDLNYYTAKLRSTIIHNLEQADFSSKELNVAVALILGQKQDLSSDVMQDYQYAGAIHILSVSGLHIGFILLFLNFILKPIPNTRKGALLKLTLTISLLALFALIAGLAPSVVRAVTMFSFIAIGYYLRRSTYIYHTIIVSLFLILLFQPYFLFDVGFQLSYIALFFILWLQPLIISLWNPENRILKSAWEILSVSVAAQIGTLPLSLYYFHQFPSLFFITNLIVIPCLSIIMFYGIGVMILAAFQITPAFIIKPFEWSIYGLNQFINWIASFKSFVLQDIPFNLYLLLTTYLCIITITLWFKKPKFNRLVWVLIAIVSLQLTHIKTQWQIQNEKEWIIFNQNYNSLLTQRSGKQIIAYTPDSTASRSTIQAYVVGNFSALKTTTKINNLNYFNGNKILVLDSTGVYLTIIHPDILVLTQSPKINLDRILKTTQPKIVVADATNYKTLQKAWKQSCKKQKIPFHATAEKGYFILN
ncbi:ComEC/Rec2 family competence protein [Flavobacterium sp.]|uniref:ComEC/Rec2 family competence protein n=1 Tax=Flavobacterium sp. TaxID=239 RepID=UPI003C311AE1